MKVTMICLALALGLSSSFVSAQSDQSTQPTQSSQSATLVGYSELPADTFAPGPANGAWNKGLRGEPRFKQQPIQGFSGVQRSNNGNFWFLSDNGFGAKNNSADYLLRIYELNLTPKTTPQQKGNVFFTSFIQLRDPNKKIPWQIVNEASRNRHLTGADFDIEGFTFAPDGTLWVGDEFGPYLLHFSAKGELLEAPIPTPNLTNLPTLNGQKPIVVGHRGSSGTRPEHTLEAYRVAIEAGADFIEPDLVVTKDGVLVARHEPTLVVYDKQGNITEATADVANRPEFKNRQKTKILDGKEKTGFWVEDFTLAELKSLKALERLPSLRGQAYDGQFEIPTLAEIIALVKGIEAKTGKKIGIYPETKHPTYMKKVAGHDISKLLVDTLVKEKFTDPKRVFIQSFETSNLRNLKKKIMPTAGVDLPLVQLISSPDEFPYDWAAKGDKRKYDALTTDKALKDIATYASGVGPYKRWIIKPDGTQTDFVKRAHAAGLLVHPWTFRNEPKYLLPQYTNNPVAEMEQALRAGVDGFFTDFPATGAKVVSQYTTPEVRSPQNPAFSQGQSSSQANLPGSGGFEGLNLSKDGKTLYAMLEKAVKGDQAGQLRLYTIDLATRKWSLAGYYPLDKAFHAIGDITPVNDQEWLVIERDHGSGKKAKTKRIYKIDLSKHQKGVFQKTLVADLMNIQDPQGLAPSTQNGVFKFPYVTIENVIVLDKKTILVANDNNYPATGGRGKDVKDQNEFIWLKLSTPLNFAASK